MIQTLLLSHLHDGKPKKISQLLPLLGCTKTHLHHVVESLQAEGIATFLQTEEGLQLQLPLPPLKKILLQKLCPKQQIEILTITDSTNNYLLTKKARQTGEVVLAEWQSAGRGQAGRQWLSPFGGQMIMSMFWHYPHGAKLEGLSVRLGIATVEALRALGINEVMLKWPNDLYFDGRKLGGILPEIVSRGKTVDVVAGIGINLIPSPKMTKKTAYLQECAMIDRHQLIAMIIHKWESAFQAAETERIHCQQWQLFDAYQGKKIILSDGKKTLVGNNLGIDHYGRILLEENGNVYVIHIGEMRLQES